MAHEIQKLGEIEMAFCKNCGTKIEDGIKFCPNCGVPVGESTQAPIASRAPEPAP